MSPFIRQLPLWLYSILAIIACTHHKTTRNQQKIAAINQKREDSYKNNRASNYLQGNVKNASTYIYHNDATDTSSTAYATRETYIYDSTGNCIERLIYSDGRFESRDLYKYDVWNRQIADYNYAEDESVQFLIYKTFDQQGNLTEEGQRYPDGTIAFKTTYEYDEWGVATKETSTKVGQSNVTYENSYDDEGVLKERVVAFSSDQKGKVLYLFDSAGNKLEYTQLMSDNSLFSSEKKKYDTKGLVTSQVIESQGKPAQETINVLDQYGNITKQYMQNAGQAPRLRYLVQYVYDDHGNWTKALSTQYPGESKSTMLRYLEYYQE